MGDLTHALRIGPRPSTASSPGAPDAEDAGAPPLVEPTLVSDSLPGTGVACPVAFPGYEILGELGRGGMGVVYRARQRNLNRPVALKVIIAGPYASTESKARFLAEAEAGARIKHPNIVQVYDVGEHAGFSYMALELIDGPTLRRWQDGRPVDPHVAARLAAAVGRGVQHAHDNGILHRDLKPANILLGNSDCGVRNAESMAAGSVDSALRTPQSELLPKVTDFGLAKAIEGGADLTMTGVVCGTPNYMAPEQVLGRRCVGPGVDVYGLGAVLYELLAGRPPFSGTDAAGVMDKILRYDPLPVQTLAPGVPRDLAVIVAKCLEKDLARRYLAVRDAVDDLERFLAGRPIRARPVGVLERGWRWVRRNPVPAAFLAASGVGCAVTGALAVTLNRSVNVERAARQDAENAQAASRAAQAAAEAQRRTAEAATERAQKERGKAEHNLRIAKDVIRVTLSAYSRDPRFEGPQFAPFRTVLLGSVRGFRAAVSAEAADSGERLDDLADMSHWLGFLEFLNGNHAGAASEYRAAATAAGAWAALDPTRADPLWRQSASLVNAGNALLNQGDVREAAEAYREAIRVIEAAVVRFPCEECRRNAAVAHKQLVLALFNGGAAVQAEAEAASAALAHALVLVDRWDTEQNLRLLAECHTSVGAALSRLGRGAEAECHLVEALAIQERVRTRFPSPLAAADAAIGALELARFRSLHGRVSAVQDGFLAAEAALAQLVRATPGDVAGGVKLVRAYTHHGEHLLRTGDLPGAEMRFDRSLAILEEVMRHDPRHPVAQIEWAEAATGRNHTLNASGRFREAAAGWAALATRHPNPRGRWEAELFIPQSLLFAGDWKAASDAADTLTGKPIPPWLCYEVARVWCLVAQKAGGAKGLAPDARRAARDSAVDKAVGLLERGKAAGLFQDPRFATLVEKTPDFAPVLEKFDPRK